jgi:hypothetical protein
LCARRGRLREDAAALALGRRPPRDLAQGAVLRRQRASVTSFPASAGTPQPTIVVMSPWPSCEQSTLQASTEMNWSTLTCALITAV